LGGTEITVPGPTIPYESESTESLKARVAEALKEPYIVGERPRPGEQRKHVFDFEDGLRLIVSREQAGLTVVMHISASFHGSVLRWAKSKEHFNQRVEERWEELTEGKRSIRRIQVTPKVIHWVGKKDNYKAFCRVVDRMPQKLIENMLG